jgi:anti-sigma regulatory factor (Ser/Thr protein kinase)
MTAPVLHQWGFRDDEWNSEVALVVSELVANAVRHAWSQLAISMDLAEEQVTMSVTDGSPQVPRQPSTSTFAESGRGVAIIQALVDEWGVERQPRGKRVWARLHVCRREPGR